MQCIPVRQWQERWKNRMPGEILREAVSLFGSGKIAFATALGAEGIVILHQLVQAGLKYDIEVFMLDTGLLFPETYQLREKVEKLFCLTIQIYRGISLQEQKKKFGDRLWARHPDLCCYLRKVLPLRRALQGKHAWITSIRREQSFTRRHAEILEWDARNGLYKINPLAYWTWEEVWEYLRRHHLPYNPLHDQGYPSVGCMPCTTPIMEGEDWRAGRWRGIPKTECGIHQ